MTFCFNFVELNIFLEISVWDCFNKEQENCIFFVY
jgi:hypothetical protein